MSDRCLRTLLGGTTVACVSRYLAQAAFGGANADNWSELSAVKEQRFVILGGKVRSFLWVGVLFRSLGPHHRQTA